MTESEARAVRDQALLDTDKYMLPDYPISPAGHLVVKIYRQKLRDWPEVPGFPDISTMPVPEDWSKYKPIEATKPQPPLVPEYPEPPKPGV